MSTQILMPALSPTMTEGKLAKWLVKEGDKVTRGQVIGLAEATEGDSSGERCAQFVAAFTLARKITKERRVGWPRANHIYIDLLTRQLTR